MHTPIRIDTREQLREVATMLGLSFDWHEPDSQDITAVVHGRSFDNAGFWPIETREPRDRWDIQANPSHPALEMYVDLLHRGDIVAQVNLATLFAMACGQDLGN